MTRETSRWAEAWPDALAFVAGLAVAWHAGWTTADLVWSLWLSSLVVGYAMIVWMIFGQAVFGEKGAAGQAIKVNGKPVMLGGPALLIGGLFLLAFFTFHFGMFHFVHSVFLKAFMPIDGFTERSMPGWGYYAEVIKRYWIFLPMAFLAERQAFRLLPKSAQAPEATGSRPPLLATDAGAEAEASGRVAGEADKKQEAFGPGGMMAPYKNVIRMHLLIFFFAFAHFAKLESFLVYAVVYAVYFFPWRLVGKR